MKGQTDGPICAEAWRAVNVMLEDLHQRCVGAEVGLAGDPLSAVDWALNLWNDHAALHAANVRLTEKCKAKTLDVTLRAWITAMTTVLNLCLDAGLCYTWTNASLVLQRLGVRVLCTLATSASGFLTSSNINVSPSIVTANQGGLFLRTKISCRVFSFSSGNAQSVDTSKWLML